MRPALPLFGVPDQPEEWSISFDNVLVDVLNAAKFSPVIIAIVVIGFAVKSWIDTVKWAAKAPAFLRRIPWAASPLRYVVAAGGLVAQAATLWLIYLVGNLMSMLIELAVIAGNRSIDDAVLDPAATRMRDFGASWTETGIQSLFAFQGNLRLDWISAALVALGLIGYWRSYVSAYRYDAVSSGWGILASFPIMPIYLPSGLLGLIGAGFNWYVAKDPDGKEALGFLVPITILCALYLACCIAAMQAARCVVLVTRTRAERERQYATYR